MTADELKSALGKSHSRGGILCDIDGVLTDLVRMWMDRAFEKFGNPEGLSSQEFIHKYGSFANADYFSKNPAFGPWVIRIRFDPVAHAGVPMIPGADIALGRINGMGSWPNQRILGYLTARPESLYDITKIWLAQHNFPPAPIVMPPDSIAFNDTFDWKADVVVRTHRTVIGIIDDNPGIIRAIERIGPYGGIVWLFGDTSDKAIPPVNVQFVRYPSHRQVKECVLERLLSITASA